VTPIAQHPECLQGSPRRLAAGSPPADAR
jgi:hypothetical protein